LKTIALIQNQVYMSYASKTDIRPLVEALHYKVKLFTAHNIQQLKYDIRDDLFDTIVFTSNSLNERTIKNEVDDSKFQQFFEEFLDRGKGCIILHQMRLADNGRNGKGGSYDFLPHGFKEITAVKRDEKPIEGDIKGTEGVFTHPVFQVPNAVNIQRMKEISIQKRGLYWHYLENVDPAIWDTLLYDESDNYSFRPLLISTKDNNPHRIIVSCLNTDWQKHHEVFENMISYAIDGKSQTAIIQDDDVNNTSFEFLLSVLHSNNQKFKLYTKEELGDFKKNIEQGNHQIVFIGPFSDSSQRVADELLDFLYPFSVNGQLKVIRVNKGQNQLNEVVINGREKTSISTLLDLEIKVQNEIKAEGFVDQSFWNTIESLRALESMKEKIQSSFFDSLTIETILNHCSPHIYEDGSYDYAFSPTVSLLWLYHIYFGPEDPLTISSKQWIRKNFHMEETREKVMALSMLIEIGACMEEERIELRRLIDPGNQVNLNEIQVSYLLRASLLLKDVNCIEFYVNWIQTLLEENKIWKDLSIYATLVELLLESMKVLQESDSYTKPVEEAIEKIMFSFILDIQNSYKLRKPEWVYPWENKATTSLKCTAALLKFEDLLDLPVSEVAQSIFRYSNNDTNSKTFLHELTAMEQFKKENWSLQQTEKELLKEKAAMEKQIIESKKVNFEKIFSYTPFKLMLAFSLVSLFVMCWLTIFILGNDSIKADFTKFSKNYWKPIISTLTFLGTIFPILQIAFKKKQQTRVEGASGR
jgi:hypothetical protein